MVKKNLFDSWPEKYSQWFETPMGRLIKKYEKELIFEFLKPKAGEVILDAGCGSGIFTLDILATGAMVLGLDISLPMLFKARRKAKMEKYPFQLIQADMTHIPFADCVFDKVVSITAIEFIQDAKTTIKELFRVAKPGGCILVATLNSLSPWNKQRKTAAQKNTSSIFKNAVFRSPDELRFSVPYDGMIKTAIHFNMDDDPEQARQIELEGRIKDLDTGTFLVGCWIKDPICTKIS